MDEDTIFRILLDRTKEEDLLRQFQETSTKPNIDILLKVSTDSACIVRHGICIASGRKGLTLT